MHSNSSDAMGEWEPALRRTVKYRGDQADSLLADRPLFGPDSMGRLWRLTHAEYNTETDYTKAVFAPVHERQLEEMIRKKIDGEEER